MVTVVVRNKEELWKRLPAGATPTVLQGADVDQKTIPMSSFSSNVTTDSFAQIVNCVRIFFFSSLLEPSERTRVRVGNNVRGRFERIERDSQSD